MKTTDENPYNGVAWGLLCLGVVGILLAGAEGYRWARHNWEGPGIIGGMMMLPVMCIVMVVLVLVMFAAAGYSLGHSRRVFAAAGVCLVLSVVVLFAAAELGEVVRLAELDRNRALADRIVTHVEAYKRRHGYYPEALSAIGKPMQTTLCFGDDTTELQYARRESGEFSLTYSWALTQYVYQGPGATWYEIGLGD